MPLNEPHILVLIHQSFIGRWMVDVPILFSVCQALHFIGLCVLMGSMILIDLRLLGLLRQMSLEAALKFAPIGLAGFALNAVTGFCFFAFSPHVYWHNWVFMVKMALILLAGVNVAIFRFVEQPRLVAIPNRQEADLTGKVVAAASLTLWVLVIMAGRFLVVSET